MTHRHFLIALLLIASTAHQARADGIRFQSLEQAIAEGTQQRKVIAVYFTARWCGWCVKMQNDVFPDPNVANLAKKFAWAKSDMDAQPHVAANLGVRGIPAILFFNADGALLGHINGYVDAETMARRLRHFADDAETPGAMERRLTSVMTAADVLLDPDADHEALQAAVDQVLELAATPRSEGRDLIRKRLGEAGPRLWPLLADALNDERLARRAAAYDLLTTVTRRPIAFDPFADPEVRQKQAAVWRQWVSEQAARVSKVEAAPAAEKSE